MPSPPHSSTQTRQRRAASFERRDKLHTGVGHALGEEILEALPPIGPWLRTTCALRGSFPAGEHRRVEAQAGLLPWRLFSGLTVVAVGVIVPALNGRAPLIGPDGLLTNDADSGAVRHALHAGMSAAGPSTEPRGQNGEGYTIPARRYDQ